MKHPIATLLVIASAFGPAAARAADQQPTPVSSYLAIESALASDNLAKAKESATALASAAAEPLRAPAGKIAAAPDIGTARTAFGELSREFVALAKSGKIPQAGSLFLLHCPMALGGKGGDWVQDNKTVANPFFGASMLRCGEVVGPVTPNQP